VTVADVQAVCAGIVGATFLIAALAKLISRGSVAPLLVAVGVPRRHAERVSDATPVVELAVALAILARSPLGSAAGLVLATVFLGLQAKTFRHQAVGCRCFGRLDERLTPPLALARAALLECGALVLTATADWSGPLALDGTAQVDLVAAGCAVSVSLLVSFGLAGAVTAFRRDQPPLRAPYMPAASAAR